MGVGRDRGHPLSDRAVFFDRDGVIVELVAYLQRTERAIVGVQVIAPIGLRHHPVDVALDLATAALLHPGRVALTVGTGEAMNELNTTGCWPPPRERMERCLEGIELVRRCWQEEGYFRFDGAYFSSFFTLYTKPSPPIPLTCAANGVVLARRAGRIADGICSVGMAPEEFRDRILPAFEQGAREAGRDPALLERMVWVPTSYHPDPAEALPGSDTTSILRKACDSPGKWSTNVTPTTPGSADSRPRSASNEVVIRAPIAARASDGSVSFIASSTPRVTPRYSLAVKPKSYEAMRFLSPPTSTTTAGKATVSATRRNEIGECIKGSPLPRVPVAVHRNIRQIALNSYKWASQGGCAVLAKNGWPFVPISSISREV